MDQIDWTPLVSQVGNLAVAVVIALVSRVLLPAAKAYVASVADAKRRALLEYAVLAAEQMWGSGTGATKLDYVRKVLAERGVTVDQHEIEGTVKALTGKPCAAEA